MPGMSLGIYAVARRRELLQDCRDARQQLAGTRLSLTGAHQGLTRGRPAVLF
jgi:hypothetical protein